MALVLLASSAATAQHPFLDRNLVVNGDAESGPASNALRTLVSTIPAWTRSGATNVLPYGITGGIALDDPAPVDHKFQYFAASTGGGTLTQDVDLSPAAALIGPGSLRFTAAAFTGNSANLRDQVVFAFKNAAGQTLQAATLGPVMSTPGGLHPQQEIGLVPPAAVRVTITLTLATATSVMDNISLVLSTPAPAATVAGRNLIVNPGAEAGPGVPRPAFAPYIPGWSFQSGEMSVAPYGSFAGFIKATDVGPTDRGVNVFCGGRGTNTLYQDLDVSPAAAQIDTGQVAFQVSAWLGGYGGTGNASLVFTFFDWSGRQLAPTDRIGPVVPADRRGATQLLSRLKAGTLPAGTRRIHLELTLSIAAVADNLSFVLAAPPVPGVPSIKPGGIISAGAFGGFSTIAAGSWFEIYGTDLARTSRSWQETDFVNGIAPTALDGVSISVGGKPAYVAYISPGQVNALAPSDAPLGAVPITVTTSDGTSSAYTVTVNPTEPGLLAPPSFVTNGRQYAGALFPDGRTFAIPPGVIAGVASRQARPGETLTFYAIGFGPVNTGSPAGTVVDTLNNLTTPLKVSFAGVPATVTYAGLVPGSTGLYQLNVVVPALPDNDLTELSVELGGTGIAQLLYVAVHR